MSCDQVCGALQTCELSAFGSLWACQEPVCVCADNLTSNTSQCNSLWDFLWSQFSGLECRWRVLRSEIDTQIPFSFLDSYSAISFVLMISVCQVGPFLRHAVAHLFVFQNIFLQKSVCLLVLETGKDLASQASSVEFKWLMCSFHVLFFPIRMSVAIGPKSVCFAIRASKGSRICWTAASCLFLASCLFALERRQ